MPKLKWNSENINFNAGSAELIYSNLFLMLIFFLTTYIYYSENQVQVRNSLMKISSTVRSKCFNLTLLFSCH